MRHKWEKKVNHPYCHERVCVKCGCVKDTTSMTNTIYWLNGEKFFNAPECKPIKINSMIQLKDVIHLYLGCEVKEDYTSNDKGRLVGYSMVSNEVSVLHKVVWTFKINEIKPILRKLSDMKEEERKELHLQVHKYDTGNNASHLITDWAYKVDWLIKHHFDLFDLIPTGQAIDAATINNQKG